jgi:capsular polysaccharide biosynthesis protein
VEPTVTAAATERIQVIQQRLMSRDNLVPIMNKFGLFPREQKYMSNGELLDLMRERSQISLLDIDALLAPKDGKPAPRVNSKSSAIAFTVGFQYENPTIAAQVANEFLTSILNQDAQSRTTQAMETTRFLGQEAKRLQDKLDATDAQIAQIKSTMTDPTKGTDDNSEQLKVQSEELSKLKASLIQASAVYSDAHPAVKSLKKRIAALQEQIAQTKNPTVTQQDKNLYAVSQERASIAKDLEEANEKLTTARLGESMERNQQAERLQVIEQPVAPQKPIKPNKIKLFAMVFALAGAAGIGCLFLAELLDKSFRGVRDLYAVVDSQLVVAIPYITTAGEISRRRRNIILIWLALVLALCGGLAAAYYIGVELDMSWLDRSWIDALTRLTK